MTEQEIEQARADVDQLDIEQLRCGVLLQLLHIEALKKERDEWLARHAECCRLMGECMQDRADMATERDTLALEVDQWRVDFHELSLERDALMSAAKLALDFVGFCWRDVTLNEYAEDRRGNVEIALRQAGVQ
jgi:hypothetical protein